MRFPHHPAIRCALVVTGLAVAAVTAGCAGPSPKPKPAVQPQSSGALSEKARQEQRQAIHKVRLATLSQLYKLKPATRIEIEQAAGYGVFEVNGLNAILAEKHGRGVVLERSGRATYMQLARTDLGSGATFKPYWQIMVFHDPGQLSQFVAVGSPANVSSDPGITVYQLNEKGVSTQSDWGARYYRNPDLN